jgi:hypothetical protein
MEKMIEHIERRFPLRLINVRSNTIDFALTSKVHHRNLYEHVFHFMRNYFPNEACDFMTIWNLEEGRMVFNQSF